MRHIETLPAWAARQRSRRLGRHSDEKVVRWINHGSVAKEGSTSKNSSEPLGNDNVVAFTGSRSA